MQWSDQAIITKVERTGEDKCWASILTRKRGRQRVFCKIKQLPTIGSIINCDCEELSDITYLKYEELINPQSQLNLDLDHHFLTLIGVICELINTLLPEHQKCFKLYQTLYEMITNLNDKDILLYYCLLEWQLLNCYGLNMDYTKCHLCEAKPLYISPKSGRSACSRHTKGYDKQLIPIKSHQWQVYLNHNDYFFSKVIDDQHQLKTHHLRKQLGLLIEKII